MIVDANGYINYSKLLAKISGQAEKFANLCKDNTDVFKLIYENEKEKVDEYLRKSMKSKVKGNPVTSQNDDEKLSLPKIMTVSQLVEARVLIVYSGSGNADNRLVSGTFGPRYLIDLLIILTDVHYYKLIHETLEAIDAYAIANNRSFEGELKAVKRSYELKLKRMSILAKEKDEVIMAHKRKERELARKLRESNESRDRIEGLLLDAQIDRDEIREELTEARTTLNQFRADVRTSFGEISMQIDSRFNDMSTFIDTKINSNNMTSGSEKWILIIMRRPLLTERLRREHVISSNKSVFDTISFIKKYRADRLREHDYDPEHDEILIERECSNSLDLLYCIKRRFEPQDAEYINAKGVCYRKIVFNNGLDERVLEAINKHVDQSMVTKRDLLERLETQQTAIRNDLTARLERIEGRVERIEESVTARFNEAFPDARTRPVAIKANGRFRILNFHDDGTITYVPRAGEEAVVLTIEDIANSIFRNRNGTRYIGNRRL